jgi:hypothetical protein
MPFGSRNGFAKENHLEKDKVMKNKNAVEPKLDINRSNTQRGFGLIEFKDRYDVGCSLQVSSVATERAIWLGTDECTPKKCVMNEGWSYVKEGEPYSKDWLINNRMHLNREQVAGLIPLLQHFVDTGELP